MKNRVLLNIICVILIITSVLGIGLVFYDVSKGEIVEKEIPFLQENEKREPMVNDGGEPPAKPEGEMNYGQMGEKPDNVPEPPQGMQEPPEGINGERPEMPEGDREQMPNNGMQNIPPEEIEETKEYKFSVVQVIIVVGCSIICTLSLGVMIVSKCFSKNIFKDKKCSIFTGIVCTIIGVIVGIGIIVISQKVFNKEDIFYVDRGEKVNTKKINLNNYDTNVTITEGGEYTLSGSFKYSVLVETNEKVILNLNKVTIEASETAAIANINKNELVINLLDGTNNTLKDGGSGDYDGCLYSNGPLTIQGNGTLNVYGNQEEGEGIATTDNDITINGGIINVESADDGVNAGGDNGGVITINDGTLFVKASGDGIDSNGNIVINGGLVYAIGSSIGGDAGIDADNGTAINGGTVIALGSDMLEPPTSSKQKYIALTLNNKIESGELITLLNNKDEVVVSFEAQENFKTIIISTNTLESGDYTLYYGGNNSGELKNNFYNNGKYSKGTLLKEITIK